MKNKEGITLISLVITIVVLVILSAVGIYLALGNNGILNKAEYAKNETVKQTATEKMNLKITNMQIEKYTEEQRMPTLQEFADGLCEDDEIQYVQLQSKKVGSLNKIEVGEAESIFTKLKEYPYEFEINSSLQLASIDGIQVATSDTVTIPKEEYDKLKNANEYSTEEKVIGKWIDGRPIYRKVVETKTPSSTNDSTIVTTSSDIDKLFNWNGYIIDSGYNILTSFYANSDFNIYTQYRPSENTITMKVSHSAWCNLKCYIILEYTKNQVD